MTSSRQVGESRVNGSSNNMGTLSTEEIKKLALTALEVRQRAHCPYSKFPVGAALLCDDGTVFTGCNIENASFGLTMCAERTAIGKAVSEGHKSYKAVAVAAEMLAQYVPPCGACRQVLAEFAVNDINVYLVKSTQRTITHRKLSQLLPMSFSPSWVVFDGQDGVIGQPKRVEEEAFEIRLDD